jgi:hypothetical protein
MQWKRGKQFPLIQCPDNKLIYNSRAHNPEVSRSKLDIAILRINFFFGFALVMGGRSV